MSAETPKRAWVGESRRVKTDGKWPLSIALRSLIQVRRAHTLTCRGMNSYPMRSTSREADENGW